MQVIWKYPIKEWNASLRLPAGAVFVHFGFQDKIATLWFLISETNAEVVRKFGIFGTGHEIPNDCTWLATSTDHAPFVWHLFEAK